MYVCMYVRMYVYIYIILCGFMGNMAQGLLASSLDLVCRRTHHVGLTKSRGPSSN